MTIKQILIQHRYKEISTETAIKELRETPEVKAMIMRYVLDYLAWRKEKGGE